MNISVIGAGYVGLVTGACFAEFGNNVVCVDKDGERIRKIQSGIMPIYEPGLGPLVEKNVRESRLRFTTDVREAVRDSLVVFLAVGTPPTESGSADMSQIKEVVLEVAKAMNGYKVIITKSTVPVGAAAYIKGIIDEHKVSQHNFSVVANPEFLREGAAINDFMRPDRVVIGCTDQEAIAILKDLYRPLYLIETPIVITSPESAEMIKYASNAFLATKVSFINEIANLCDLLGADVHDVAKAMGMDKRIGSKFLHPGPGFGGSCFPKDARALVALGMKAGYDVKIVKAAIEINELQRCIVNEKIKSLIPDLKGKCVGVLGLAFKPETDDIREAPSLKIIADLLEQGATIRAFDPAASEGAKRLLKGVEFCSDEYDTALGADALVVVTEWNQFRNLDFNRLKSLMKDLNIIDLRNVYEPETIKGLGFKYVAMGRS